MQRSNFNDFFEMMNNDFSNVMGVSLETQRGFAAPKLDETKRNANRLYQAAVAGLDEEVRAELGDDYLVSDHALQDKEGGNYLLGAEYADQLAGGDVWGAASGLIEGLPPEEREAALARLNACGTAEDGTRLLGELWRDQCRKAYCEQEALENARYEALHGNVQEIVRSGSVDGKGEAWTKFFEDYGKGVWGSKEEAESMAVSIQRATEAFGMVQHGMLKEYTEMGSKVLTNASSAISALDALKGDEVAEGLFFQAVQDRVQDVQTDERERVFWEKLGRSFLSAGEQLAASAMGGHFRAFVTDEQVERFNAERGAMKERAKRAMGRGPSTADRTALSGFAPEDEYWEKVYNAAKQSGQLNADGSLRKMTEEERQSTEVLNKFRGQLFNAVQGGYDSANVFQKMGRMMPSSLAFLVPGGAVVSAGAMYTEGLANRLAKGEDFVTARQKAAVDATLGAMVEKMAFGSLKPTKWVPGLDWLMSRKVMAKALGGVYGTASGRLGMGALVGTAEETFAEPLSQLLLSGVYNAVASEELRLDDPVGGFQKELDEMLKPEQLLVTAIYGLLLGGVNAGGHRAAAKDYRRQVETLVELGVDEGRAAQVARIEDPKERREAVYELIDQRVKEDSKGVLAYLAEVWPQLQNVSTMESFFEKSQLPRLIPAGEGMVKVQEKQDDGKASEVVMAEDAAMLLVQARLEELSGKEMAQFADAALANAMVGAMSKKSDKWDIEVVDERMDHDYFERLANAAGIRTHGKAWQERMLVARHDYEEAHGKVTDEEWAKIQQRLVSRVNRTGVRGADGRLRTLFRVARGGFGAMEVLEDITEDNLVRDMEANGRTLDYYVKNLQELEAALGKQGAFLRKLKDSDTEGDRRMAVVEAMGKLVQSKVLADTAKNSNMFSAALNAFLEMLRSWVLQAKAMMKLGAAVNKVLTDAEAVKTLDAEFVADVERLAQQDIEFLRELQLEEGLKAMQRVLEARQEANADRRVKRRRKAKTPVLDKAEKNHGKEVREAARKKRRKQAKVDADVAAADAALDGDFSSSVVNQEELDAIKSAAEKDGTFMKAPNGEPTNLTEQQWLQVRTAAFKRWFGDWERAAELTFNGEEYDNKTCLAMLIADSATPFENDETGIHAAINNRQRGKITSGKAQRKSGASGFSTGVHNYVAAHIRQLFKHAIHVGDYKDRKASADIIAIKRFVCPVKIQGVDAFAYMTVKELKEHGHKIYTLELDTIERLGGNLDEHFEEMLNPAPSKEILARVNELRKTYFDNVSKIIDSNGEPLVMYHGTARSKPISIFKGGKSGYLGPGIYFTPEKRTASKYTGMYGDGLVYEGFVNMRNPLAISYADKPAKVILDAVKEGVYEKRIETQDNESQLLNGWSMDRREAIPFNETLEYTGEALVSFSVSDTLMEDIAMARKRAKNADGTVSQDGEMSRNDEVELCTMPDFMRFLGEPDVPVVARVFTLRKLLTDHKLTDALTYEVVQKMNDPVLAIQETPSKLLLLLDMESENKTGNATPVVAIIEHKQDKEGSRYLVSAYPLEDDKETKVTNQFNKLVYCKYSTTAKFPANAPQDRAYELLRAAISGGHTSNVACKEDVVKWQQDFSSSLVNLDEEVVAAEVVAAGQGFRANLAYSEAIMREMRGAMQRLRKLGSKTRTDREDAVAAMGTMVQMVKAAVAYLPKGYRFSVHPYLNRIEALAELAATGDIDLTSDIASKDILEMENAEGVDLKKPFDEMVKEYGNVKLAEVLERIMHRVSEQLRKHAKDRAVEKITELVERLAPKKDPKTGKLKGGKMSADAYRDLATVAEAMGLNAEQLEAKLAALRADMAKPGISEELREELEDEMLLYDQFGDLASMTAEEAVAAYEALRVRVYFNRFEWDDKQARIRGARRAVVRRVVDGVGSVSENEYNAKKRRVKPSKRLKNLGDILSGMPAALAGMRGYLPLRQMADELALRANAAGEAIKAWEAERWLALEALSKETMGKSWRECMDFMHKVQPSGVSFDRPKFRTVNVKTEELRELLAMTKEERKAEMKRRREAGGLEAERALSERDVQELQKKLEAMEEEGRVLSRVETRYMVEVQHEENLQLSRGEALYAILMFEQPTYTERLIMQGYTFEVIEGLREYVGDGMLQFGYGLRELFAKQGDRIAAVYENAFGVPFPREENYFAARWVVNGMKENPAEQLLAGMAGTAGAGNGWMKQRVNHNLELDMTKDALQVFLQATSLTDTWMATQDIVADFKAWTRDADFERALTAVLGKESYDNLKDWIRILEMGGVQDCLNMGVSQDVINGLYGSGAVAILGLRIQTLLKQTPSIFNGLLGAHDISAAEWFATMSRMKNGDAPMTYKRMVNSTLMKMRQQGKAGNMAGQAMRSGDTASSAAEGLLMASMLPMEWVDARCMAIGLVPVWNVYYQRAVDQGASAKEAEQAAWEQTALVANLASQPIGWLNKSKIAQSRNPIVKSAFYMLSENTAKFALCRALWRGGKKMAAFRAWLVYGAANAAISAMLDALQGDPEEWEKGNFWEYVFSALYGPAAGIPGVGEMLEGLVNSLLNLTGEVADIEWMKKVKMHASAGRALVDFSGSWKAMKRIYGFMTDNKEHSLAEYTRAAGTVSRTLAIGTGWMGNMFGYWSTVVAVLMNPIDFGARVWRNMKHYWE